MMWWPSYKLVGLVAAVNPELESPGPKDLYKVGVIATVHRLLRAPDGTVRLLVQGTTGSVWANSSAKNRTSKQRLSLHPSWSKRALRSMRWRAMHVTSSNRSRK